MGKSFNTDRIAYKVDTEKIKRGGTDVYLKSFSGNGNGAVISISLDLIDDFPNHPFRVTDDEDMQKLVESIKENGVLTPINVIPQANGRYFSVAGHRRRRASRIAGLSEIPAIVSQMTEEEAIIAMVDTNLQRERILPSEKARAYQMKLEAIKRQGKRTDLTSTQLVSKLRSADAVGAEAGDSREQVRRYVRLTHLTPKLLDMVDENKMPLTVGVELSYLRTEEQLALVEIMKKSPTLAQATELGRLSKESELDAETMKRVLCPSKATSAGAEVKKPEAPTAIQTEKATDVLAQLKQMYVPQSMPNWTGDENTVMKGYILKACALWNAENADELIPQEVIDNLMTALRWATDDLTAQEAYDYYMRGEDK